MILSTDNKQAFDYFKKVDKVLYRQMVAIGIIERSGIEDPFTALVSSILSQQISTKAADTIYTRLIDKVGTITPSNLLKLGREDLKNIGISYRKTDYILTLCERVVNKEIDFNKLKKLSNEEIIKELITLPGVGIWTVEMLLLFSFRRDNVISYNDLMIREGMKKLYGYSSLDKALFNKHVSIYKDYASLVSLYLWHISKLEELY